MSSSRPWDDGHSDFGRKPCRFYKKITLDVKKLMAEEEASNLIEVGGYKWKMFAYPLGRHDRGYLALFLSVANHKKLYQGWSYLAQFTITLVNNDDPKKSKQSDALHCFCEKNYECGWEKFILRRELVEGFMRAKAITIELHIQVISERTDRLFRCLSRQYMKKLVPIYFTDVEQVFSSFVDEKIDKLTKLLGDKYRWSRLSVYWLEANENEKRSMSSAKSDLIIKDIIKQVFKKDMVTSTLAMDSIYYGLKSLDSQEKTLDPIIKKENNKFVLMGDMLQLLKNVVEKVSEDGGGVLDVNEDPIEVVAFYLTVLGRRFIEIFVLDYIFRTKIEDAYEKAKKDHLQEPQNLMAHVDGYEYHELFDLDIAGRRQS